MSTVKIIKDVAEFHEKFGLHPKGGFQTLTPEERAFAVKALYEEVAEYEEACTYKDKAAQFDALIDLIYFAAGRLHLHSFPFLSGWNRVHAANMKKVRASSSEESKRGSQLDVVKPEGWRPPDLLPLLTSLSEDPGAECYIVEGPDAVGKTTFSKLLAKRLDAVYIHMTRTKNLDRGMEDYMLDQVENARVNLEQGRSVVFDRSWISELCYGAHFRDRTIESLLPMKEAFDSLDPITVFCLDEEGPNHAADRHEKLIDEAHPYSRTDFIEVYKSYLEAVVRIQVSGAPVTVKYFDETLTAEESAEKWFTIQGARNGF